MSRIAIASTIAAALFAQAAHAVVLPPLDPVALDQSSTSISGDDSTFLTIQFVNNLDFAVNLYWIDYSGNRVFYQTIAGNSLYNQGTYLTHPWVIAVVGSGDTLAQDSGTLLVGFLGQTAGGTDIANINAVPEPGTWALLIAGFTFTGTAMRRRRKLPLSA